MTATSPFGEANERAARLPRGFTGIWRRLTGEHARIKRQNEQELLKSWQRDRAETDALICKQLEERQTLQADIKRQRVRSHDESMRLRRDILAYQTGDGPDRGPEPPERSLGRGRSRERRQLDR